MTASDSRRWQQLDLERPPGMEETKPPARDYTGWLIASYLSIPVLGIGLPVFIGEAWSYDTAGSVALIAGLTISSTLPAIVHWSNGDSSRGVRDILIVPLATAAGLFTGAWIGSSLTSDAERRDDDQAPLVYGIAGALIGGGIAVAAWATFDLIDTANESRAERRSSTGALRFALAPSPGGMFGAVAGKF